jgi:glycerol-3-phosphate dehydrogenase
MAEDAIDAVTRRDPSLPSRPSPTRRIPLVGAWPRHRLGEIDAAPRFVRRYGAEAPFAAALPDGPGAARGVTAQELQWGVAVEGALSVADLLDRRTRLGLVATDVEESTDAAAAAFARAGVEPLRE